MNKKMFAGFSRLFVVLFVLTTISCSDDPLKVGIDLLPDTDHINAKGDTLPIECFTAQGIPLYANYDTKAKADNAPIGHSIDPIFGDTWADVAMELVYNSDNLYTKDKKGVDNFVSCKLYLQVDEDMNYGGKNGFNVNVYPLKKQLNYSLPTNYVMKSEDFDYEDGAVSTNTVHLFQAKNDSIEGIDSGSYYLVVELSKEYTKDLMDTNFIKSNKIYKADYYFKSLFPGFYLRSNAITSKGGINNFFYKNSRMVLNYKRTYQSQSNTDSVVDKYSTYTIDYYQCFYRNSSNNGPEGPFKSTLDDTINQKDLFFVQSLGGVWGYIRIPELDELKSKNDSIGINMAEIVFPINKDNIDTTEFFSPLRLTMVRRSNYQGILNNFPIIDNYDHFFYPLQDDYYSSYHSPYYFNGYLNKESMEYRINMTEYVHQYISGRVPYNSFYLIVAKPDLTSGTIIEYKKPGRVVLNSGINTKPAFLRVIYTKTNL